MTRRELLRLGAAVAVAPSLPVPVALPYTRRPVILRSASAPWPPPLVKATYRDGDWHVAPAWDLLPWPHDPL
jgi:hypothetical protein